MNIGINLVGFPDDVHVDMTATTSTSTAELLDSLMQSSLTDVTPWSRDIRDDHDTNDLHDVYDVYIYEYMNAIAAVPGTESLSCFMIRSNVEV